MRYPNDRQTLSQNDAVEFNMNEQWSPIPKIYDPLKAGSIDGTDEEPHDEAVLRAMNVGNFDMEELEACSIGLAHNDQCHKTSYSKMTGLISGSDLREEDLKIIAWRSGLRGGNVSVSTICLHHKYLYSNTVYWTKYGKCCDPLDTHTRKVKGICKIGLAFAEELENIGINIVPGQKLCPSCLKKVKNDVAAAAGSESSTSTDESTPGTCKEVIKHKLNQSLEN
ncbi:U11/U12 small nuclear ribonucleoprotein [Nymphon striatum]|nr:U11/U12 small nuclear ribonucleoprotein [Nymphon striatum]